jgi:hypothetical protein
MRQHLLPRGILLRPCVYRNVSGLFVGAHGASQWRLCRSSDGPFGAAWQLSDNAAMRKRWQLCRRRSLRADGSIHSVWRSLVQRWAVHRRIDLQRIRCLHHSKRGAVHGRADLCERCDVQGVLQRQQRLRRNRELLPEPRPERRLRRPGWQWRDLHGQFPVHFQPLWHIRVRKPLLHINMQRHGGRMRRDRLRQQRLMCLSGNHGCSCEPADSWRLPEDCLQQLGRNDVGR